MRTKTKTKTSNYDDDDDNNNICALSSSTDNDATITTATIMMAGPTITNSPNANKKKSNGVIGLHRLTYVFCNSFFFNYINIHLFLIQ